MARRSTTDMLAGEPIELDLNRLRGDLEQLPRKQRQLANVLLEKPEVFAFGTLDTIEGLLAVSGITVIRFAKRLGFSGYQALQAAVRQTYLERSGFQIPTTSVASRQDQSDLLGATLRQHRTNLSSALDNLQVDELTHVATLIRKASRVLVCGSGSAAIVAQLLVRLLRHVGLRGEFVDQTGIDEVIAVHDLEPQDIVIGIGFWLSFASVMRTLRLAKRFGAQTVAIVGSPVSPMSALADHTLHAPAQGAALSFSSVGAVAVVECLIAALADQDRDYVAKDREDLHELYVEEDLIVSSWDGRKR